jgi:ATP-binding cassette subfamily B protein/subfamily B ATP-binding cassette protein MsbA
MATEGYGGPPPPLTTDGSRMKNFGRVVRLALRYRLTFIVSIITALLVAILWGANISAVYPVIKVAFQGESLQDWVVAELDKSQQAAVDQTALIAQLEDQLADAPPEKQPAIRNKIGLSASRIEAEETAVERYTWLQPYVDNYLPSDVFQTLIWITVLLLLGTVLKSVFLILNNVLVERLAQLAAFDLRKLFYRRTLRLDMATFGDEGTSDLMSRFTHDMECVASGLSVLFGKLIREPLKMIACLVGAGLICWRLLLLSMVVAPVAGYLVSWLAKMLKRANRRAMEEMALIYSKLEETFRGIKIVKAFTSERQQRRQFHQNSKAYYAKSMRIAMYDSLTHPLTEVLGIVAIGTALLAGAWLVLKGETHLLGIRMSARPLDVPSLLLFYGLLAGVADPLRKFSDVFSRLQRAVAAADRIYDRLDREPSVHDPARPVKVERHHLDLVFDGVDFAYRPDQQVLNDIRLRIPFGQTVAIVGPNGCGKSSLANLIPRFYDPTGGRILLDGVPLTDMRLRDLRRQIGLVTQETLLFDDTIFNNIRYGSPWATRDDVIRAAQQAHAHEFIDKELADGYETVAGTLGGRLSGGQRQRISLARAMLRNPAIIVLDEATSQIDLESEQAIQAALEQFVRDRTTIIITHRMGVLALADQIVVMKAGRILDVGNHQELLARCAFYRRLYQVDFEERDQSKGPLAA